MAHSVRWWSRERTRDDISSPRLFVGMRLVLRWFEREFEGFEVGELRLRGQPGMPRAWGGVPGIGPQRWKSLPPSNVNSSS